MKHLTGVRVVHQANGDTTWTMATGHVVTRRARPPLLWPSVETTTRTGGAESSWAGGYPAGDTAARHRGTGPCRRGRRGPRRTPRTGHHS